LNDCYNQLEPLAVEPEAPVSDEQREQNWSALQPILDEIPAESLYVNVHRHHD
jgi:hypothetical protein